MRSQIIGRCGARTLRAVGEPRTGHYRDRFDFDPGQPGSFPATVLEQAGRAKPFDMTYERRQTVSARVKVERGGKLRVVKDSVQWGNLR